MYLCIGKIVNTHGIKGEIKLLSSFDRKDKVFVKGMTIYIGNNKEKHVINTYRRHKCFDMITLDGIDNINDVLKYKGSYAYVLKEDLKFNDDEYLDEDLIAFPIYKDGVLISVVDRIEKVTDKNKVLVFTVNSNKVLIPFVPEFVVVDYKNKRIDVKLIEGMM